MDNKSTVCKNCGKEIGYANKCCFCGEMQSETAEQEFQKQEAAKSKSKMPTALIVLLIVAAVAFYVYKIPRTIGNRSIQYDETKKEYSLLFGFQNMFGMDISANADFDIWIKNDGGSQVYSEKVSVDSGDFAHWQSIFGKSYLGCIKIPASKIRKGYEENGTIYFKVETGSGHFDTSTLSVYNLPVVDYSIAVPELPIELAYRYYNGSAYTKTKITDVKIEDIGLLNAVKIIASCEKTYDRGGKAGDNYCMFDYRLLDQSGTVVQTGSFMSDRVYVGDKFNAETTIYEIDRSQSYTIELIDG